MSIRLRLACWYGGLTGIVLIIVLLLTYAIHTRAHYADLDRVMVRATAHLADEYRLAASPDQAAEIFDNPVAPDLVARAYGPDGTLLAASPSARMAPAVNPRAVMEDPSGPPYDRVVRLAPSLVTVDAGAGTFGIATDTDGNRWRLYAVPVAGTDVDLLTAAPLERIDTSVARFRQVVILLTFAGATVTLIAGALLAGRALRPVALVTQTAIDIRRSRALSQRVPVGSGRDELDRLAATFNDMLASLEQAAQAQQRFVSDASHELRAPLTIIQANLEFVEQRPALPDADRQEAIEEASREARRLASLVGDLLALARADAGVELRHERVELDRVLLDAYADARRLARGQRLEIDGLEPVVVEGDRDRLKQLLIILFDNAVKYTPPEGRIAAGLTSTGDCVEIRIRDEGVGIPAEDLPHVFERFYRADPARSRDPGGTGLGLSIARWIAQQHGGDIRLTSEVGRGTTAVVRIPVAGSDGGAHASSIGT
jgi:signal transduction histidine kinase